MHVTGPIPDWLLSAAAAATLFAVMFDLGLSVVPREFRWVIERPRVMARALFSVLVAVPAIAWIVARAFDVPRSAEIGIMLMAIAPGAPVALRRTLDAGGHAAFAQTLHIALAILAIFSMPLGIAALGEYYGIATTVDPRQLARQVFAAQLLPLGLGVLARHFWHARIRPFEPVIHKLASLLLLALVVLVLIDVWETIGGAGLRVAAAVIAITMLSLAAGHGLGGPDPTTRTATAIFSGARNAGLALLVATLNDAAAPVVAAVLATFVLSAFTILPYAMWRRRAATAPT
jgi:bile acid:Na+ symporter, BASS family